MGNCLVSELKKPNSGAPRAVVPLNHATEPPPLPQAALAGPKPNPKPKPPVRFAEDGDRMREPAVRVKVVLTKKEAARLLATLASSNGSALESMLCELERARSGGSPSRGKDCWRPALESIPED